MGQWRYHGEILNNQRTPDSDELQRVYKRRKALGDEHQRHFVILFQTQVSVTRWRCHSSLGKLVSRVVYCNLLSCIEKMAQCKKCAVQKKWSAKKSSAKRCISNDNAVQWFNSAENIGQKFRNSQLHSCARKIFCCAIQWDSTKRSSVGLVCATISHFICLCTVVYRARYIVQRSVKWCSWTCVQEHCSALCANPVEHYEAEPCCWTGVRDLLQIFH